MTKYIFTILASLLFLSFGVYKIPKLSIEGAWSIAEVQTVNAKGEVKSVFPKESEIIFTNNYYSFCWTSHQSTIRSWQMTDSMKLDRLNQTIVNTGTYQLKDSLLTTKALFAMNPMFVNGEAKFKCSFHADTLILTGLSVNSSDNVPNPLYANGSHIVNKLIRSNKK